MLFLLQGQVYHPLSIFVWHRFEAIIKYRAWHPLRGRPRSFRLFLSVLHLTGFHSRPTGSCEPPEPLSTFFTVQARLARLLRASRASECVFQCKHGWYRFEAIRHSGYLRQHVKFPPWCLRQIAYLPHYSLSSLQSVHSVAVNAL